MEPDDAIIIVSQGTNVTLQCSVLGASSPSPYVTWFKNLALLEPDYRYVVTSTNGQGSLVISDVTTNDAGQYSCVVRSNMGSEVIQPDTRVVVIPESSGRIRVSSCALNECLHLCPALCLLHMYTHTDAHTYTHTHALTHAHTQRHTCTHTRTRTHTHTHTHTHTYTRTHTYTHTCIPNKHIISYSLQTYSMSLIAMIQVNLHLLPGSTT